MSGKLFKKKKEIAKHMPKKHKHNLVPSQRYQDSRHLLQNPTVPNYVIGFSNCAQRFTGSNYLDVDSPFHKIDNYCLDMKTFYCNIVTGFWT